MKVFVTGASGIIGQRVVPALLAKGHSVTAAGHPSRFALFHGPGDPFSQSVIDSVWRGWMPICGRREGYVSMVTHHDAAAAVIAALAHMLHVKEPNFLPPWLATLGGSLGRTIARSLRISNRTLKEASDWQPAYRSIREGFKSALEAGAPSKT